MQVLVTGTGTEIGKTVVSAVLLAHWAGRTHVTYWKPVATGAEEGSDSQEVASLAGPEVRILKECYRFGPPLSPHLAARLAGVEIEPERILSAYRRHRESVGDGLLVVEGIGGLLVPLTDRGYLLADLLKDLALPCLVVASSQLGTINHTLLTLEALRSRDLSLAGVVLNGPANLENRRAIERFGRTRVVAELQPLNPLSCETVARTASGFDRDRVLERCLLGPRPDAGRRVS
ncbi:MAG: dethiobiotin synthase [Acidobacteriota bacterium]|nr:dethiobiotin synthase [Acidobacteriota bacterium]